MHNAIVRNAKAKPIERTFCTFKNQFSRCIPTFCGGTILERPESLKYKLKHGIIPEEEQIRLVNFIKPHKSYYVNLDWVDTLKPTGSLYIPAAFAGVVLLTLTAISNSACAVCFCQPREPAVLYSFIKGRRKYNEKD